ncbi:MAG: pectate lyase [Opitutus sp.]|nr:pectate lyase [Opitutus sp.]
MNPRLITAESRLRQKIPTSPISPFRLLLIFFSLASSAAGLAATAPYPWPVEPQFLTLTLERIASLPAAEQPAWRAYLNASQAVAAILPKREAFVTPSVQKLEGPGIPGKHSRGLQLFAAKDWYAGEVARAVADRVVAAQTKAGGWTKGNDYTKAVAEKTVGADVWSGGTLDNDATTWELRFLALAAAATADAARAASWRESFGRGLRYVLASQYPNGGFPQIYPLAGGYHDAITFNDDATVQALELLRDLADGKPEFAFVSADLRSQAGPSVARGLRCLLDTQLRAADGRRTVWCQQHDALTLKACAARNFEPVAACTNESAALVKFLMTVPNPSPEVRAAVQGAIAWFNRTTLRDLAWTRQGGTGQLVARPGAPPLWARMYELGTDRPIFGDRDRTVHFAVAELSSERRAGYAWYGAWPASALAAFATWPGKNQ